MREKNRLLISEIIDSESPLRVLGANITHRAFLLLSLFWQLLYVSSTLESWVFSFSVIWTVQIVGTVIGRFFMNVGLDTTHADKVIDEPFRFNTTLQHIIVTLFFIFYPLSISFYFSFISLSFRYHFHLQWNFDLSNNPKNLNQNIPFFFILFFLSNFSSYFLVIKASISEEEYVCVLPDLEYLITKFTAWEQENSKASQWLTTREF